MFEREEPSGPPHSALHLVGDPQHPVLIAKLPDCVQVSRWRGDDPGAALHGFQDQRPDPPLLTQQVGQGPDVAERHPHYFTDQLEMGAVARRIGH
jgi:hypothetical protein